MISRVPVPLQSVRRDFVYFNWVGPHHHEADGGGHVFCEKGWQLLQRAAAVFHQGQGFGGEQNPKRLKQWLVHGLCMVDMGWKAESSASCLKRGQSWASLLSPVTPPPLGQSWGATRSLVPGTERLNGHMLLQVGQWLMESGNLAQTRLRQANPPLTGIFIRKERIRSRLGQRKARKGLKLI